MIRQGAKLVESAQDILEELHLMPAASRTAPEKVEELAVGAVTAARTAALGSPPKLFTTSGSLLAAMDIEKLAPLPPGGRVRMVVIPCVSVTSFFPVTQLDWGS